MCFLSGGLAEEVDEKVLHAAFIPFGDVTDIQIPLDYETGKIRSCVSRKLNPVNWIWLFDIESVSPLLSSPELASLTPVDLIHSRSLNTEARDNIKLY